MEPKIIELEAFKVAGLETYGGAMSPDFGKMWDLLMDRDLVIPDRIGEHVAFGICSYQGQTEGEMNLFYMASVQVESFDNLPPNVSAKTISANTYAIFEHHGVLDETLKASFGRAYGWVAASQYEKAGPYDFERYGEKFKGPQNPDSILEIYVPIQKKG